MALRFIAKDPNTDGRDCPTVWVNEATSDLVLQGWTADDKTQAECLTTGHIPESESVIRIPARMASALRRACDVAESTEL